jgi:hypothetical protein
MRLRRVRGRAGPVSTETQTQAYRIIFVATRYFSKYIVFLMICNHYLNLNISIVGSI